MCLTQLEKKCKKKKEKEKKQFYSHLANQNHLFKYYFKQKRALV